MVEVEKGLKVTTTAEPCPHLCKTRAEGTCGQKPLSCRLLLVPSTSGSLTDGQEAILGDDEDSVLPHHQDQTPYPVIFQDALQQRREMAQRTGQRRYSEQQAATRPTGCERSSKNSSKQVNSQIGRAKGKLFQCQTHTHAHTHARTQGARHVEQAVMTGTLSNKSHKQQAVDANVPSKPGHSGSFPCRRQDRAENGDYSNTPNVPSCVSAV